MVKLDNFITMIIFTLPGILAYFLIQNFGITPVQKHQGTELLCISALLCAPVAILVISLYNLLAFVGGKIFSYGVQYLFTITDLNKLVNNLGFLLFYLISSIFFSYIISRFISSKYDYILKSVNKVRTTNGYAPYSKSATVWKEVFQNNDMQFVKISSFGNNEDYVVGCVNKVSRDFESEERLVIEQGTWKYFYDKHKDELLVDRVVVCSSSGLKIDIFDKDIFEAVLNDHA